MPKLKLTHAEYLQILAQRGDIEIDQDVLTAFLVTSKHPGTLVNRLNFASTCFPRSMADISEREKRILTNYQQWKDKGCSAWQGTNALASATLMYAATYATSELDTPEELEARLHDMQQAYNQFFALLVILANNMTDTERAIKHGDIDIRWGEDPNRPELVILHSIPALMGCLYDMLAIYQRGLDKADTTFAETELERTGEDKISIMNFSLTSDQSNLLGMMRAQLTTLDQLARLDKMLANKSEPDQVAYYHARANANKRDALAHAAQIFTAMLSALQKQVMLDALEGFHDQNVAMTGVRAIYRLAADRDDTFKFPTTNLW